MKHNEYTIEKCAICKQVTALKNGICLECNKLNYPSTFLRLLGLDDNPPK